MNANALLYKSIRGSFTGCTGLNGCVATILKAARPDNLEGCEWKELESWALPQQRRSVMSGELQRE